GWPLFGEDLLTHVGDKWPLFLEGEKCAVVARNGGAVGLSFIGSANAAEIQAGIRRLVAAHVAGVVYVADHDDTGRKKAAKFEQTCNEGGLKVVVLHAADVWPGLPAKGSIDDVDDTPENIVRTISAAAEKAAMVPLAVVPKDGKRKRMAPDEVMERIPTIMGELRQDVRSGDIEANGTIVGRNTIGRLYLELSSPSEQWPKETTADAVLLLASQNQFDPVVDYLNGLEADALPMDQWGRLDRHLLGITDPVAGAFLPRYFVAAVARAFEPGCDMRQLPVLVGPQWRGKSALGKILFGAKHWVEGIGNLDKDALMRIHTSWGVELAELDGVTRRADLDSLKAFISETSDLYRKPYDRAPENHHRRFVFWGTANRSPLRDTTGNTRFVCIKLPDRMLPLDWAVEHRDSIWARAVAEYRAGKQWSSCSEEERKAINDRNKDHQEEDPWEEKIANFLAIPRPYVYLDDLLEMLEIPIERRHGGAGRRVAGIVEAIGWERDRRQHGPDRIRAFWPPRPKYNRTIPIDEII
ncbi:MAG: hypothetical protein NT142_10680, partial [Planctomycetota bacterium]|nr:hypothetical protein [Planctomycetota bacterium]